ncbi:MAG TPA: ImcF-related family protein [Gemmatimonas sp.]|uniref:ImcF-related family protein n=1 Tax=Gemmatimonas sp. TaxID=1962908 RepID=UPI002ED8D911
MASRKPIIRWLIAAAVLLLFIVILVVLERTMTLDTVALWVLRVGLVLLGLIAAGAILWFLRPQDQEPVLDTGDDVLLAIGAARGRLPRGSFASRALVLLLGPEGSAKTTLVSRSGGDPQLLAGDAPSGANDVPPSTKTANVWAMQNAVVAELASGLLTDAPRFAKVVRALRAPRVAAAMGQGEAAPRAAVICVPSDLFYAGGNGEQLQQLAQSMRQRLAEAARELGLALPVYVMFTKMDRVPHFEPWVSVFTKDELRAPLGATLAFDAASNTGNYAERLAPRLDAAFAEIAQSVGSRRVDLLGRETQLDRRYASYELPRELRKLQASATQFLVELCRPTQLGSSPQLRGFYFTGARPVVVTDVGAAVAASTPEHAAGATGVFRRPEMPTAAAAAVPVTRKVPEWVFLDRFLREVVVADTGAASVARGGVSVQRTRRVLLGTAIAATMLVLLGVTASWLGNRSLQGRVASAASAVAALPVVQASPGTIAFPSAEALTRLDALRAQLDTLQQYEQDGPPLRMRFGLWRGTALLEAARPVWFDGFRKQLFADAWGALNDSLKTLPDIPTVSNDYGVTYGWLKGYLITTTTPDSSTSEFLTPVLLTSWQRGMQTDADITALARRQFEYYATVLPKTNPYPRAADAAVVSHARDFLSRFTGAEQIYLNMIGAANKQAPPVAIPQAPGILTATQEVQGAFSTKGASFMSDAFRNADRYFQGETWVVGDATASKSVNRDSVVTALRGRYADDYVRTWRQVVQSATVVRPSTVKDAADKLDKLAGVQSPLLQVLRTVAVNTAVDSAMRMAFQPVHAVTPPEITDKFVSEKNQPYMDGLLGLQGALLQVSNMPPAVDTPSTQALVMAAQMAAGDVTKARVSAKRVSQGFDVSNVGGALASPVEQLLLAPITGAEAVLKTAASQRPPARRVVAAAPAAPAAPAGGGGGAPSNAPEIAALNERGRALCTRIDQLTSRFPFNPDATADASVADVKAILAPNTGELWVFQQERLAAYLEKSGNTWAIKPGGKIELSKSFVDFFNRAAEVSGALFAEDPTTPMVRWLASGVITPNVPLLTLKNNGKEARFDQRSFKNEVIWPATNGREAELLAQFKKNKPLTVRKANGDWAIFRLVATADAFEGQNVTWNATGKDAEPVMVKFEALRREASSVLTRGWLGRMSCVAQVTK